MELSFIDLLTLGLWGSLELANNMEFVPVLLNRKKKYVLQMMISDPGYILYVIVLDSITFLCSIDLAWCI